MRLLILIIAVIAQSQSLDMTMGAGLHHVPQSAIYSLGLTTPIDDHYAYRVDVGAFSDNAKGHRGSIYTSVLLGREWGLDTGLNGSLYVGILFITQPDIVLSTPFQFTEEISIMYDNIGIVCKHISNASLKKPNKGRDYCSFKYRIYL